MGMKILDNISINMETESYIDALHPVLTGAGLYDGPKYMLFGMTGMAFKFVCHKRIIVSSKYLYHIDKDSWKALDRLGIYNEIYCGFKENPTFFLYQKKAMERIKESIDRGVGVLLWEPGNVGFGVIFGYDDGDSVFYYKGRYSDDHRVLMYDNLGRVNTAFWLCQVIGDRVDKDIRDIYIDSMECAIDEWENYDNVPELSKHECASGRRAYDYMINGLEGSFDERGMVCTLREAIISRHNVALYIEKVVEEYPELYEASKRYNELDKIYKRADDVLKLIYNNKILADRNKIPELTDIIREAKQVEEGAVDEIKAFLSEILYNRYIDPYDVKKFQ